MNKLSKITGEFCDRKLEEEFQSKNWPDTAAQFRIVVVICSIGYLLSFFVIYQDLGVNHSAHTIVMYRIVALLSQLWVIAECYARIPSRRMYVALFLMEISSALSESSEFYLYMDAGQPVDPLNVPFFAFIILIYYGFLNYRFWWTAIASLTGSVITLMPYAFGIDDAGTILFRHSIVLFGVIVFGAGFTRRINYLRRSEWSNSLALQREVLERQKAEEDALRANAVKDEFLASVSHELRNPLHAIIGTTKILQSGQLNNEIGSRIALIKQASKALLAQVNGLLDFAHYSIRDNKVDLRPINIRNLAHSTSDLMTGSALDKSTQIRVCIDEQLDDWYLGDEQKIQQILLNLLSNAIKYGDSAPIRLIISKQQATEQLLFVVEDDGPGVDKDFQTELFNQFRRHKDHQYQIPGIGLGLAISRKLAHSLNGQLSYECQPKGARFVLGVPLRTTNAIQMKAQHNREALLHGQPHGQLTTRTILLVEDDTIVRGVTRDLLKLQGHQIHEAASAEMAREKIHTERIDLILCDQNLPGMSGSDMLRSLREQGYQVPAFLLTANALIAQQNDQTDENLTQFDAILTKPLQLEQFSQALYKLDHKPDTELVNKHYLSKELQTLDSHTIQQLRTSVSTEIDHLLLKLKSVEGQLAAGLLHSLASVASNLGLSALQEHCEQLENRLHNDANHSVDFNILEGLIADSLKSADEILSPILNPSE